MIATDVIERVRIYVNDLTETYRWDSEDAILPFINDGQRQIAQLVIGSYTRNESVQTIAGTKQSLPDNGLKLFRAIRNMGTDGTTLGRTITNVTLDEFQVIAMGLHTDTASGVCQYVAYDPRDPKRYYNYPAQPATPHQLELSFAAIPADTCAVGDTLGLDNEYLTALARYTTAQLLATETEEGSAAKVKALMGLFYLDLGLNAPK